MSDILLRASDLSVRFGGVLAVDQVSFDVREGEVFTLIPTVPARPRCST